MKENVEFSNSLSEFLSLCVGTEIFASRKRYWFWLVNPLIVLMSVDTLSALYFKINLYTWGMSKAL